MSVYFHNTLVSLCLFAFSVVPKLNNVFSLELDGFISYIYGSKFLLRASERSAKKFKLKGTIDLWFHGKSEAFTEMSAVFLQFKEQVFWQMEKATATWNIYKAFLLTEEWAVSAVFKQSLRLLKLVVSVLLFVYNILAFIKVIWLVLITWLLFQCIIVNLYSEN